MERGQQSGAGDALAMVENSELSDILKQFEELPDQQLSPDPWAIIAYAWAKAYADPSIGRNDLIQKVEQVLVCMEEDAEKQHLTSHLAAIRAYWLG
jgi:ATP/maltotriose-dependent transcriptional regulator MalT